MAEHKKHNERLDDFSRYLNDQMSNEERNRFERSMERDPFDANALEGFSAFKMKDVESDLAKIDFIGGKRKVNKKLILTLTAVAVLLAIVTVFVMKTDYRPKRVTSTKELSNQDSISLAESSLKETTSESDTTALLTTQASNFSEEQIQSLKEIEKSKEAEIKLQKERAAKQKAELNKLAAANNSIPANSLPANTENEPSLNDNVEKTNSAPDPGFIIYKGHIISAKDKTPVQGVNIKVKGRTQTTFTDLNGNFSLQLPEETYPIILVQYIGMVPKEVIMDKDMNETIIIEPDPMASEEAGTSAQKNKSGLNAEPQPHGGMGLYKEYLDKNLVYPKEIENQKREVIKVTFKISYKGDPFDIEVTKSPGEAYTYEATRLILDGPKWSPAILNGKPTVGEVNLRIVFKP